MPMLFEEERVNNNENAVYSLSLSLSLLKELQPELDILPSPLKLKKKKTFDRELFFDVCKCSTCNDTQE